MKNKKVGVLFSGGKDSCLALHKFGKDKVDVLLSMIPEHKDSYMFHTPILKLLKKQAEMLGTGLVIQKSKGEEEKELNDLKKLIKKSKVDVVVIGGLASSYQGKRIKKVCKELNVEVVAPLWGYTAEELWDELLRERFKVIITKIASEGIGKEWIGKIINKKELGELRKLSEKYKFRLDFEGGDAETAVMFMPEFKRKISLDYEIESEGNYRHFLKVKRIK